MGQLLAASSGAYVVVYVVVVVLEITAIWRLFTKAGRPGWAAIIPIYNAYVLLRIVGRSGWWLLVYFIPLVNLVALAIVMYDLARSFGRGGGFAIGLFFLSFIFVPILGFGPATYRGPAAG
ncbi:MAG TPA: DUF5684 domain-containing protein [Acidimicrobiales bacterium]|nr:DUF5684 domain-containing protein [Acidimicrobiales bacterium]